MHQYVHAMLELQPPLPPMEALSVEQIPVGPGWQYEPKWDGFRCLAFRNRRNVYLQSKAEKPLARYFPEVVEALLALKAPNFVLDGEIAVPVGKRLAFDELLQRIHPAESRIRKLSAERPAIFIVFDLLADERGLALLSHTLAERRPRLERFARRFFPRGGSVRLSPATTSLPQARKWFGAAGANLDGVIAKRLHVPYRSGDRTGMVKIKHIRSADCVVGGFRYGSHGRVVGSLLLGLYDDAGLLHHVGFTSNIPARQREALTKKLERLVKAPGFTGSAPGGPSRWSSERSTEWEPLAPKLVVEVAYDHFTAGRFRHGTSLLRWRPDKAPRQCTLSQVEHRGGVDLRLLA
jgi:ATP-dependent DNA ligase